MDRERTKRLKIGFTCGAFDLLHAGHVVMLQEAKRHCDFLVVGLQTDPSIDRQEKNRPVQSVYERWVQLSAINVVDKVIPYDTEQSLIDLLESQSIDVRFVGEDYKDKSFTGDSLPIRVVYTNRKHSFSTTNLRKKVVQNEPKNLVYLLKQKQQTRLNDKTYLRYFCQNETVINEKMHLVCLSKSSNVYGMIF